MRGLRGVCSGGHPLTSEAGRRAFEAGGNAIDAAVAAQLMATVAEPLLTGLGGGGLAMLKRGTRYDLLDCFSNRPGLGPKRPFAPLEHVDVEFGVDVQRFSYGVSSVATPGMIHGLWALHRAGGVLPLPKLARWAADVADRGLEVSIGLSKSIKALAPIIVNDPYLEAKFFVDGPSGRTVASAGHPYALPELSETLMRWASGGPAAIFSGSTLRAIMEALGEFAALGVHDLESYDVHWRSPRLTELKTRQRPARMWTSGLPSQGGVQISALIEHAASALTSLGKEEMVEPLGVKAVEIIAEAMRALESKKGSNWPAPLVSAQPNLWRNQLGFTTHLSTYDDQGNAVGITSSLGETAGVSVDSLGLLLNNFMGEEDVAPPRCLPMVGERLFTMCSPTLLEIDHLEGIQGYMLGSGGSSRIRSVIAHGVLYLVDGLLGLGGDLNGAVKAPRIHLEGGKLRLETFDRPEGLVDEVRQSCEAREESLVCFEDLNLFFGGLHLASGGALGLGGAGDPRRSGSVSFV